MPVEGRVIVVSPFNKKIERKHHWLIWETPSASLNDMNKQNNRAEAGTILFIIIQAQKKSKIDRPIVVP